VLLGHEVQAVAQQHQSGRIGRPEELATNLSMSLMSFSISAFVAPLFTGFAIDSLGARTALLTLIAYVVPGMLIVTANRELFPGSPVHANPSPATPAGQRASRLDGIRSLLRVPDLKRVYVAAAISQMVWDTINLLMPLYGKAHGFSASEIGMVLGVFSLFTLVIRLLLPALSRRFKPWQLLILSLGSSSLSYFAIPLLDSMPPLIVVAAWLGIAIGVAAPMLLLLIHNVSPQDRLGEAVGFRVMINGSSQTLMPLVTGSLAAIFGLTSMFWLVGLLLASGAAINRDRWRQAPHLTERASC
jgi:predicted MFS family arabinose efflux permease